MNDTSNIICPAQLKPVQGKSTGDRRVWSIPLAGVWLPFFLAANAMGESAIPAEVLGAPVRLVKEGDGTPKFSKSGRPVVRVVRELSDQIRIIRDNFTYRLQAYATTVANLHPEEYKAQVEAAQKAGEPVITADAQAMESYLAQVEAQVEAQAEGKGQAASAPKKAKTTEKELVPA